MPTDPYLCTGCDRASPACTCVKDGHCGTCGTDLGVAADLQRDLAAENARLRERVAAVERETADVRRLGASIVKAKAEAIEHERASIVRWLRAEPETIRECDGHRHPDGKRCLVMVPLSLDGAADAIESGAHRTDDPLPSALADLTARLAREERDHGITIDQRDRASGAADALAYAIGTVEDIGEHSNLNDPWANALDHLDVILAAAREAARAALTGLIEKHAATPTRGDAAKEPK